MFAPSPSDNVSAECAPERVSEREERGRSRSRSPRPQGSSQVDDAQVRILVMHMHGGLISEVKLASLQHVGDVKAQLVVTTRIPARYQRLIVGTRDLDDEKTLAEEGLAEGTHVTLVKCAVDMPSFLFISDDDPLLVPFLTGCCADPDETDENGWTALHWAAQKGHTAFGKALLACPEFTAIDAQDLGRTTALHSCARQGRIELCRALLARPDLTSLDVRSTNGNTALHWAARSGHSDVCMMLLESTKFSAVNDQNVHGWTALHYAAAGGLTETCKALLIHPGFNAVSERTNNGETALHWAALNGEYEICKILIDSVDATLQDVEGLTAFDGARSCRRTDICELLRPYTPREVVDGPEIRRKTEQVWNPFEKP